VLIRKQTASGITLFLSIDTIGRQLVFSNKMAAPGERRYVLRLIFSIIGITVGLSVCVVFGVQYKNWNTSLWGLASGKFLLLSHVIIQYKLFHSKGRQLTNCHIM